MESLQRWIEANPVPFQVAAVGVLAIVCYALHALLRRVVLPWTIRLVTRSRTTWDDALHEAKVFARLAHLPPAFVAFAGIQAIPGLDPRLVLVVQRVAVSWMVLGGSLSAGAFLSAANEIYAARPENRDRPVKGYLQVIKMVLYLGAGVVIIATLMDRSPWIFLSGIGAMTAILLLIFKDTILSLVASVQLTGNEMLRVGDWIEVPQYGADGDVIDVALHTVKVLNWDKTVTTIPTHKLISESFKNWRSMSELGGRRIKRTLTIDMNSIRFLEEDEIERFGLFALLKHYITEKRTLLRESNSESGRDPAVNADIRRLTNVGTYRAYIVQYLRNHPKIHQEMTLIIRQKEPTADGLPLEIYAFTNDTAWSSYEDIQSDIFDHLLAIAPEFGLSIFQNPSGRDLAALGSHR